MKPMHIVDLVSAPSEVPRTKKMASPDRSWVAWAPLCFAKLGDAPSQSPIWWDLSLIMSASLPGKRELKSASCWAELPRLVRPMIPRRPRHLRKVLNSSGGDLYTCHNHGNLNVWATTGERST